MQTLQMRRRRPSEHGGHWESVVESHEVRGSDAALLICDMWDRHWCVCATTRCAALAEAMNPVITAARKQGMRIIHAPSDCMDYYADWSQRKRMRALPRVTATPVLRERETVPLPIDDSDGGCDDADPALEHRVWTRQHAAITIADEDGISDDGLEVLSLLKEEGRTLLLIMGVHTNMCMLNRSFAIRQMVAWGMPCALVRDMTDAMYNPAMPPYVRHDEGTRLVIEHIEAHYCPTITSDDLR